MHFRKLRSALLALVLVLALAVPAVKAGNTAVERKIFEYLTGTMGFNSAAACGILANIEAESDFNLGSLGDSGTSYGLCQWHNSRFDNLRNFCLQQGYDYRSLEGQLAFLNVELRLSYAGTYSVLRQVPNTPEGAYYAAYYWCIHFEAPANGEASAVRRGRTAQVKFWGRYGGETVIDSLGYSGNMPGIGGSLSSSFYWESEEPEETTPSAPYEPAPTTPAPTDPIHSIPDPTAEPESPTEPEHTAETPPRRFHYVAHHRPRQNAPARFDALSPFVLLFLCGDMPWKPTITPELVPENEEAAP